MNNRSTNPVRNYRESEVASADGTRLVVLAYEGAIGFLRRAQLALEENRQADAARHVVRAQKIVVYLLASLDPSAGEIAANLTRLYAFALEKLASAAVKPEPGAIDAALGVLDGLRSAWAEIAAREQDARAPRPSDVSVCA